MMKPGGTRLNKNPVVTAAHSPEMPAGYMNTESASLRGISGWRRHVSWANAR